MPKSKVRKKATASGPTRPAQQTVTGGPRVKIAGPSSTVYISVMVGLMILGLLWLVVNYLWGSREADGTGGIPGMRELGNWNFLIGFALMISGLIMAMRWR